MSDRAVSMVRAASRFSSDRWLYAWGLGYAAIGVATLLIPLYALSLGAGPLAVGVIEATAGLAGVPGALLWGRLADRTGNRRAFVLGSLAGTGVVLSVFPFQDSVGAVLVANGLFWFVVSAATPVVTLFMIEAAPEPDWERRIGLLNAYQRYGWVGGLLAGSVWIGVTSAEYSVITAQRSFFFVCSLAALVATPLAFYWLPPTATVTSDRLARSPGAVDRLVSGSGRYVKLVPYAPGRAVIALKRVGNRGALAKFPPALRQYWLTAFVFSAAFAVFFGPVPAFLTDLAYTSTAVFGFFILASLASAVVFVPAGRMVQRVGPKRFQLRALGVRALVFPAIGLVGILTHTGIRSGGVAIGFAVVGITWAVVAVTGAGLVSRSAPRSLRGEALGVYTALSGIGGGVGGVLGGLLATMFGYPVSFGVAGVLVLLSALMLRSIRFDALLGAGQNTR